MESSEEEAETHEGMSQASTPLVLGRIHVDGTLGRTNAFNNICTHISTQYPV